jgi:hypothetical protein
VLLIFMLFSSANSITFPFSSLTSCLLFTPVIFVYSSSFPIFAFKSPIVVIYATSFCVNWARGTRLKHERSENFKAPRAIRKAQFTQKRVAYKILLFETTSLKLSNLLKMVSHLLLTVLTNFSRSVRNVTLNVLSRATIRYLLILL